MPAPQRRRASIAFLDESLKLELCLRVMTFNLPGVRIELPWTVPGGLCWSSKKRSSNRAIIFFERIRVACSKCQELEKSPLQPEEFFATSLSHSNAARQIALCQAR